MHDYRVQPLLQGRLHHCMRQTGRLENLKPSKNWKTSHYSVTFFLKYPKTNDQKNRTHKILELVTNGSSSRIEVVVPKKTTRALAKVDSHQMKAQCTSYHQHALRGSIAGWLLVRTPLVKTAALRRLDCKVASPVLICKQVRGDGGWAQPGDTETPIQGPEDVTLIGWDLFTYFYII